MSLKDWIPLIGASISAVTVLIAIGLNYALFRKQERLKNELGKTTQEHQVRMSWLHAEQVKAITDLRANIYSLIDVYRELDPIEDTEDGPRRTFEAVSDALDEEWRHYQEDLRRYGLLLDQTLCARPYSLLDVLWRGIAASGQRHGVTLVADSAGLYTPKVIHLLNSYSDELETVDAELKVIIEEIESEFRSILGVLDEPADGPVKNSLLTSLCFWRGSTHPPNT